jgi:tetrapyrrole methylase family protein / MazG family protein
MTDAAAGVDALIARAGLDPADGLQIVAGGRLGAVAFDPSLPLIILRTHEGSTTDAVVPGRHARSGPRAVLAALYPPAHALVRLGDGASRVLADVDEPELLGGDWFVAALDPIDNLASPHGMAAISARLRAPDGCPWDRKQTHLTLRPYLLEEAYETVDAIEHGTPADLAEELGDLLLQVILHAQFAAEAGEFDLTDVYRSIGAKIVRRHPHVFGDAVARTASDVNRQWERIKADERATAAEAEDAASDGSGTAGARSALDGISPSMPALAASQEMQERAANLGYDWPSIDGVLDKVAEEADELREAASDAESAEEFGDLLFVLVNVARRRGIEAEAAVRAANAKFRRRFASVERGAAAQGVALRDLDFAGLDALWDAAKAEEKTS